MSGHTPGPWRFQPHADHSEWLGNIIGRYGLNSQGVEEVRTISCQTRYESHAGEALANARLSAAAPELLRRLQIALDMLETFDGTSGTCAGIRKSIALATGVKEALR